MDSLSLRAVTPEIAALAGLRLVRAVSTGDREIRLELENDRALVLSFHPDHTTIYPEPEGTPRGGGSTRLTRSLETALAGARLTGAVQHGLDRILFLLFQDRDRLGDPRFFQLVLEATGKRANLVLVEGEEPGQGRVRDRLREDRSRTHPRRLSGGAAYEPPGSRRTDATRAAEEELAREVAAAWERGKRGPEALVEAWEGASTWTAWAVWVLGGGREDAEALARTWRRFLEETSPAGPQGEAGPRFRPTVVAGPKGPEALAFDPRAVLSAAPRAVLPPDPLPGSDPPRAFPTMTEALAEAHRRFRERPARVEGAALPRAVKRARVRTEKALEAVQREAADEDRARQLRRRGEMLLACAGEVTKGAREVTLPDPATGEKVRIRLNPALSAAENAALYFKKARKAERAGGRLAERVRELQGCLTVLDGLLARLRESGGEAPDRAWLERAREAGVRLPPEEAERLRTGDGDEAGELPGPLRPRRYDLGRGWEVLVGRNDRGNHVLTFELSRPDDWWMHAEGCPGSHVLLRHSEKDREPPRDVLLTAAGIAAWFSRARNSTKVPIVVARKRHVRRPRKAPVGQALVGEHRTFMVVPIDPAKLERT